MQDRECARREVIIGVTRAKIVKNKIAPPFRTAEFDIMNKEVFKSGSIIDVASELAVGVLESWQFYKYKGEVLAQGRS